MVMDKKIEKKAPTILIFIRNKKPTSPQGTSGDRVAEAKGPAL
jgi:hypothetical protein